MSKAAKSLFIFGLYSSLIGLVFLIMPNLILRALGFSETNLPWIRIMAMLLLILAYYDIQAARQELVPFMRLTVHARAAVIIFFTAFVLLEFAHPFLIVIAVVDLLGAVWTWWALRSALPEKRLSKKSITR